MNGIKFTILLEFTERGINFMKSCPPSTDARLTLNRFHNFKQVQSESRFHPSDLGNFFVHKCPTSRLVESNCCNKGSREEVAFS